MIRALPESFATENVEGEITRSLSGPGGCGMIWE